MLNVAMLCERHVDDVLNVTSCVERHIEEDVCCVECHIAV